MAKVENYFWEQSGKYFLGKKVVNFVWEKVEKFLLGKRWRFFWEKVDNFFGKSGISLGKVENLYWEKVGNIFYTAIWVIIACAILYGIEGVSYKGYILGFFGNVEQLGGMIHVVGNLFYFSVVVFSTVGFGDIVPIGPLGKSIMVFEGIIGGLIMAVLIIALYKQLMDR